MGFVTLNPWLIVGLSLRDKRVLKQDIDTELSPQDKPASRNDAGNWSKLLSPKGTDSNSHGFASKASNPWKT